MSGALRVHVHTGARARAAAVLAGCLLAACSTAAPSPGDPASYADHRRAAVAESLRVLALTPVPAGSTRLTSPPGSWSGTSGSTLGPSDGTLTQTAWWTVAGDAAGIERTLLTQTPSGMRRDGGVGESYGHIKGVTYYQIRPTDPDAFTGVGLLVQWALTKTQDGKLLVRADTFVAARAIRNPASVVGKNVRAVTVREVRGTVRGTSRLMPAVHLRAPADAEKIRALVEAVNALRASTRPPPVISCPAPPSPAPRVTMNFNMDPRRPGSAHHTYRMKLPAWCEGQLQVIRDGRPVDPALDPANLLEAVHHILGQPRD